MSDCWIEFLTTAAKLKTLRRAGWVRCGVEPCESVAEHTFGVALLALLSAKEAGIDRERCLAMALVHDLAESIVGDITPHDAVAPDEKHRRERAAIGQLTKLAGDGEIVALWEEFEAGQTAEAKLVRDLDVIEMAQQAIQYQSDGQLAPAAAAEFVQSAKRRITTDVGRRLFERLCPAAGR